ncbi:hypothetical protein OSB04_008664 [Centaurea solstitialis]|uniref:Uncharacterized protein n=1 Tax=Centaurea solstitialis TaxID=347529 RepID=A0AA38TMB2_9ASTR|nr:hypothetical protein OSB04_008664 [Centaurea solstitialis]
MRIRKNANISAFLLHSNNHQTSFCQLNQSPWDIISFPHSSSSSLHQYHQVDGFESDYNVNLGENWSSIDSIGAIQRPATMRIRKNANISAFLQHTNHQSNFCQLNQSPWDIITFPPSSSSSLHHHHQVDGFGSDYNVNVDENWSSIHSIGAIQSNVTIDYELYKREDDLGFMGGDEDMVLCGKQPNGKEVKNGSNIICGDRGFDPQNESVWGTDKKKPPSPVSRSTAGPVGSRPRRAKKRAVAVTSNRNEFYYYSGFGPSWGKKRGPVGDKCTALNACDDTGIANGGNVCQTSGVDGDAGVEEEENAQQPDTAMMTESWSCEAGPTKEDLDYMDEEENDGEKGKVVKKRGRKPIKARSLKSLM